MEKLLFFGRGEDHGSIAKLEQAGVFFKRGGRLRMESDEAFIAQVGGHEYVVSGPGRWNAGVIERLNGSLKMIVKFGAGVDNIDIPAATRGGIAVSNAPGANAEAVAEHSLALMLGILRRIEPACRNVRQGKWGGVRCDTLIGKTVGLVGFGHIGRQMARLLGGFPVKLLACDVAAFPSADFPNVRQVGMEDLLEAADVVSLHLPLLDSTREIVDRGFLARMKQDAYLINTSRGGLVNEADLAAALRDGTIRGAALDTLAEEPPSPGNPLLAMDNVLLTPHCASLTDQAMAGIFRCCIGNVVAFKTGAGDSHILNPQYKLYLRD